MAIKSFRGTGRGQKAAKGNYKKAEAISTTRKASRATDSNTKRPRAFSSKKMGGSSSHASTFHKAVKSQKLRKFHSD